MSTSMPIFDTLKYAESLKAAGVPDAQAKAHASSLNEAFSTQLDRLATKEDLRLTVEDLRLTTADLRHEIQNVETRLDAKLGNLRMLIIIVGLGVAAILPKLYFPT